MQAHLQPIELLAPIAVEDDQLPIEHVATRRELDLREVAAERLSAPRLQVDVFAVDEGERAKAVVLGLIHPVLALGQDLARERELWLDRWFQRECDFPILVAP